MVRSLGSTFSSSRTVHPVKTQFSPSSLQATIMNRSYTSTLSSNASFGSLRSSDSVNSSTSSTCSSASSTEDFWQQYKRNKQSSSLWKLIKNKLSMTPSSTSKSVVLFESPSLERESFFSAVEEFNASQSFSSDVICEEDYEDVFDEYTSLFNAAPQEFSKSFEVQDQMDSSLDLDLPPPLPLRSHQIRAPARPPVPHS